MDTFLKWARRLPVVAAVSVGVVVGLVYRAAWWVPAPVGLLVSLVVSGVLRLVTAQHSEHEVSTSSENGR
jgi:hypothetical protein